MKMVYVAHKIRDPRGPYYVERHIRDAEEVAVRLWRLGAAVICPGANTRHFDGAILQQGFGDVDIWLRGDLEMVSRCDAVVMAPGWETSDGAKGERAHALVQGIPVFEWPESHDPPRGLLDLLAAGPENTRESLASAYAARLLAACRLARTALHGERDLNGGGGDCCCGPNYRCVSCTTEAACAALDALVA